jgi:hypothetical protein
MDSRPLLEIACKICAKPLDLSLDLSANESGEAVHADYSVRRLISAHNQSACCRETLRHSLWPDAQPLLSQIRITSVPRQHDLSHATGEAVDDSTTVLHQLR